MALKPVSLDDKYSLERGHAFMSGTQALVRLPMLQRQRDRAAGLNTGGFISGYRGSPLGAFDQALWAAKPFLQPHNIQFQPAVNEELGATAVWGSQQLTLFQGARVDGVFGIWYGKGPGLDRSLDAIKHANFAGTARHGGVLAIAGDDHACKSSTVAHQSEQGFIHAMVPVISPAGVQEFLDLGQVGWAMSRWSGCWVGFTAVADTIDTSAVVEIDPDRLVIRIPEDFELPPGGLNIRLHDMPLIQEDRLVTWKLDAARAFARANRIDRLMLGGQGGMGSRKPRFGIVTVGKSYLDVRQALDELGITEEIAAALGLAVYKVALSWPLEPHGIRAFAEGLDELLVVEEKRSLIEAQVKDLLYNLPASARPRVVGKQDEAGTRMLGEAAELAPAPIARVIGRRLLALAIGPGGGDESARAHVAARLAQVEKRLERGPAAATVVRTPFFCSGCPHNTSTRVPDGSRALAGIGCHYMVTWMDRSTDVFSQMGGEGAQWIGQAPFTDERHVFANLGDGTYFHSGILAVRAAVAAGVNITYKLLYNDAVAMTGGQKVDGSLSVADIARQLEAEGVRTIRVVSDEPDKYGGSPNFPPGTQVAHRDELDRVQKELRDIPGVSLIIYDQTCAAEKRRRRKRGTMVDPPRRVVVNELVCEGCGDCSDKSNCLSVVPVETEWGRRRQIDQSSCNKDFSCLKGFCPSFVTVEGGALRKPHPPKTPAADSLPEPVRPALDQPWNVLVTGIGGTGVVTIGAILGMAAHLEDHAATVLDMAGLAQKGGAVTSHIRLAARPADIAASRISAGTADLVLACDVVVATAMDALAKMTAGRTRAVVNSHETITAAFVHDPEARLPTDRLTRLVARACGGDDRVEALDATRLATALCGDSIATNLFMLGHAYQKGLVPVSAAAIEQAIQLNGAAVRMNTDAFRWGRQAALDLRAVEAAAGAAGEGLEKLDHHRLSESLDQVIDRRAGFLADYQDAAYAARYRALVERVRQAEAARVPGRADLTEAVARNLFRLMAYKDEYEVARLYTDGSFRRQVQGQFEGDYALRFHLAPPLLARRDPETGHLKKQTFGPWMMGAFALLAKLKGLRGTWADPFGHSAERKAERRLIGDYTARIEALLAGLTPDSHALAVEIARIPERIRGYGHIKEAAIAAADRRAAELMAAWHQPRQPAKAAE